MSTSTDAMLAYGVDLGELGDDGLSWVWDELEQEVDEERDPVDLLQGKLPEGVTIEEHCSSSAPMYLLTAHVLTARRGYPEYVDPASLSANMHEWDALLGQAMDALGLRERRIPRWLLCSWWSQ